jgi:endonuclease V-like protein UPF0215 family
VTPARARKEHVLSIDDAPFDKFRDQDALLVGVVTAGPSLVEGVITTRVPIDGEDVTVRLAAWAAGSRFFPSLRAILIEGITVAGLSVVDLPLLRRETGLPVISVDRKPPPAGRLEATLARLGYAGRIASVAAAGSLHAAGGIHFACAGIAPERAREIIERERGRSRLPEGIRIAHLIGQAIVLGESKGRA